LSVEHAPGVAVHNTLIQFIAEGVWLQVVSNGMVVGQCIAVQQVEPVHVRFATFAVERQPKVVSDEFPLKGERVRIYPGTVFLLYTPLKWPSIIPLYNSLLKEFGCKWSATVWLSASVLPFSR